MILPLLLVLLSQSQLEQAEQPHLVGDPNRDQADRIRSVAHIRELQVAGVEDFLTLHRKMALMVVQVAVLVNTQVREL
jgi:hypothetical protein